MTDKSRAVLRPKPVHPDGLPSLFRVAPGADPEPLNRLGRELRGGPSLAGGEVSPLCPTPRRHADAHDEDLDVRLGAARDGDGEPGAALRRALGVSTRLEAIGVLEPSVIVELGADEGRVA